MIEPESGGSDRGVPGLPARKGKFNVTYVTYAIVARDGQ